MNNKIVKIIDEKKGIIKISELVKKLNCKRPIVVKHIEELSEEKIVECKLYTNGYEIQTIKLTAKGHQAIVTNKDLSNVGIEKQLHLYKKCFNHYEKHNIYR